jgi:ribosomal peptide maturation radical SAM protein 1
LKVVLVNPPFANYRRPSIALTQLRAAVREALPAVEVAIHNINLDCVPLLGTDWYSEISDGFQSWTGLGDWLFRPLVFPEAEDNAAEFLQWLASQCGAKFTDRMADQILSSRQTLCESLPGLIRKRALGACDVIGVSSMFSQNLAALAILRLVKALNPAVVAVIGGANCESPMGDALVQRFPFVDRAFSGRAVTSFTSFLQWYQRTGSLDAIPPIEGVLSRQDAAAGRHTCSARDGGAAAAGGANIVAAAAPDSLRPERVFEVPALDYDEFVEELSAAPFESEIVLPFETSIGCWWGEKSHCTFCGLNSSTMEFRALSADEAVTMINSLVARYSHVCQKFEAVDNILSHKYLSSVLPRLQVPEMVSLFYEVKANLSEADVHALAKAQVRHIQPGIEALSTQALQLLRKGVSALRNVTLLRNCRRYGIGVDWNLLVAIPGEIPAIYAQTLRELPKLVHLEPPAGAFDIRFDRFSPYFRSPDQFGLHIAPFRCYAYLYPCEDSWLSQVAYFFEDAPEGTSRRNAFRTEIDRLHAGIELWKGRWACAPEPVLESRSEGGATIVIDGRDGSDVCSYCLEPAQADVLSYFKQPRQFAQVRQLLQRAGVDDATADDAIAFVRDRGWLFEEDAQAVSIVVDRTDRLGLIGPPVAPHTERAVPELQRERLPAAG